MALAASCEMGFRLDSWRFMLYLEHAGLVVKGQSGETMQTMYSASVVHDKPDHEASRSFIHKFIISIRYTIPMIGDTPAVSLFLLIAGLLHYQ